MLMLVFWYSWKRGRETRLAKEGEAGVATDESDAGTPTADTNATPSEPASPVVAVGTYPSS